MSEEEHKRSNPLNQLLLLQREEKKLSIEEVADRLNLSVEQVEWMETETLDPEKMTPFERGYVRNYAGLLGINEKDYSDFSPTGEQVPTELHSVKRYNSFEDKKPFIGASLIKKFFFLIVLGAVVWLLYQAWPDGADIEGEMVNILQPALENTPKLPIPELEKTEQPE